jgi:hypothetical protein
VTVALEAALALSETPMAPTAARRSYEADVLVGVPRSPTVAEPPVRFTLTEVSGLDELV